MRWKYCLVGFLIIQLSDNILISSSPLDDAVSSLNVQQDDLDLEYKHYIQQVIDVLDKDDNFKPSEDDGLHNVGQYLELASSATRNKLDELKRLELRRLKDAHREALLLAKAENTEKLKDGLRINRKELPKINRSHINVADSTFTSEDLTRLISRLTRDLSNVDAIRKKNFKQYEMEKEKNYRAKLKNMPPVEQQKLLKEHLEKAKKHASLNHPGSRQQLMEVWEKMDNMDPKKFDPKLLFLMHDIDGDGLLNPSEVEALFLFELDKLLNISDMVERDEEMNRMREHVFNEIDTNRDSMISLTEFINSANSPEFNTEQGWKTVGDEPVFTEDELKQYEKDLINSASP